MKETVYPVSGSAQGIRGDLGSKGILFGSSFAQRGRW